MVVVSRVLRCMALAMTGVALAGCPPEQYKDNPTRLDAVVQASADLNPDNHGRPSPVVVRLYELTALGKFEQADFFSLYENGKGALGRDLVRQEELEFLPGAQKPLKRTLQGDTRFVGVVAAYRDLEQAQWRASFATPYQKETRVTVKLGRLAVSIQP